MSGRLKSIGLVTIATKPLSAWTPSLTQKTPKMKFMSEATKSSANTVGTSGWLPLKKFMIKNDQESILISPVVSQSEEIGQAESIPNIVRVESEILRKGEMSLVMTKTECPLMNCFLVFLLMINHLNGRKLIKLKKLLNSLGATNKN